MNEWMDEFVYDSTFGTMMKVRAFSFVFSLDIMARVFDEYLYLPAYLLLPLLLFSISLLFWGLLFM